MQCSAAVVRFRPEFYYSVFSLLVFLIEEIASRLLV